jgi:hypothetical protein
MGSGVNYKPWITYLWYFVHPLCVGSMVLIPFWDGPETNTFAAVRINFMIVAH